MLRDRSIHAALVGGNSGIKPQHLSLQNGHLIIYRAGKDSRVDRANIALLRRIVRKSTTPVQLEVFYHSSLKLAAWSEPQERVRYIRMRNGSSIPVAERTARSDAISVLVLSDSLLLSAGDIWQLLGHSVRESLVVLTTNRILKDQQESFLLFFLRDAFMRLNLWLYPQGYFIGENLAVTPALFREQRGISGESFHETVALAGLTGDLAAFPPLTLPGRSYAVGGRGKIRLLKTAGETAMALVTWRRNKKFPWWFSSRHLLFHVAQVSAYLGALVAMVSLPAGMVLLGFALVITPQFSLTGYGLRRPWLWPARLASRLAVYFLG